MLFITNREPKGSIKATASAKPYDFDLDKNSAANSVFYCERTGPGAYTEIGSAALLARLRDSRAKQVLLYIHGFSNLPEDHIFPRAETMQALFDEREPDLVDVVPMIWPCDNDIGIVKDYWDDQKSADQSAYAFARVLERFMKWRNQEQAGDPCRKRINVLAHSMGNRVLRETLNRWDQYDLASGVPLLFRNTFLVAADIVNEALEENGTGRLITDASRNVSVYFASDDLALRSSKVSNLKNMVASRRLGHTGPEDMLALPSNVYAIDCDDFNNTYDSPMGHSYFLEDDSGSPGSVFKHMFQSIKTGRVVVDDPRTRTHVLPRYWNP